LLLYPKQTRSRDHDFRQPSRREVRPFTATPHASGVDPQKDQHLNQRLLASTSTRQPEQGGPL
jgi:hypothetical protein